VTKRGGYSAIASALVVSAVIVGVAVIFASSVGGSNISSQALAFARTESAIAALTTSQGAIQRSVAISQADPTQSDAILDAASVAILISRDRVLQLEPLVTDLDAIASGYFTVANEVGDSVANSDFEQASVLVAGDLSSRYELLVGRLIELRDDQGSALQTMDDRAAAAAQATRFVIGLAVPLAVGVLALGTYRRREAQRILQE